MVAAGFVGNQQRPYNDQRREWRPRQPQAEGLQQLPTAEQLAAPCRMHMYTDRNGNRTANHLLQDCRQFRELAELIMRQQQAALQAGHPQVPGAIAIGAPPPPQHIPPQANMAQVMQYHQHPQEPEACLLYTSDAADD